jgi:hypothetical protein
LIPPKTALLRRNEAKVMAERHAVRNAMDRLNISQSHVQERGFYGLLRLSLKASFGGLDEAAW